MAGRRQQIIPRRRFTLWAAVYFSAFVGLPILSLSLALDYGLYRVAKTGLVPCISVFCLLDDAPTSPTP
jgi:hypothetical protein